MRGDGIKKRMVFVFLFLAVLCFNIAFSDGSFRLTDANKDAQIVRAYFHGASSETEAAASFDRLYDFMYKDAREYVLNRNKGKFHHPDCSSVTKQMKEENKVFIICSRDYLLALGYDPCGNCKP